MKLLQGLKHLYIVKKIDIFEMFKNIYDIPEIGHTGEILEDILKYKNVAIKRIVSSSNLEKSTFCQEEAEWVLLLEGSAKIMMGEKDYTLSKGDSLFIPPKLEHTIVTVEAGTIWLAIHIYEKE